MLAAALVLLAVPGQAPTVGVVAVVMSTVMLQLVWALVMVRLATVMVPLPAVAVTLPPTQLPPTFGVAAITSPDGSVSTKLTVWVGLLAGCVSVKVSVLVPPTAMLAGLKALLNTGVAAITVTHAPVVLVPLVALLLTAALMLVVPLMLLVPLVLLACGQTPAVGVVLLVTGTMMVQVVAGLTI